MSVETVLLLILAGVAVIVAVRWLAGLGVDRARAEADVTAAVAAAAAQAQG